MTTIDFITEVADETAQGKFLKTCVHAHLRTNLSILKLLSSFDISVKNSIDMRMDKVAFVWYRQRPLKFQTYKKGG